MSEDTKPAAAQSAASPAHAQEPQPAHGHSSGEQGPMIHRVCIQCNNMFSVPAGDYATKQCSVCHKG